MRKILFVFLFVMMAAPSFAQGKVSVTRKSTLGQVFVPANVGKKIDADYNDLTDGSSSTCPFAEAMINAKVKNGEIYGPRTGMSGTIYKNFDGRANTYYCMGYSSASSITQKLVWVYDANKKTLYAIVVEKIDGLEGKNYSY